MPDLLDRVEEGPAVGDLVGSDIAVRWRIAQGMGNPVACSLIDSLFGSTQLSVPAPREGSPRAGVRRPHHGRAPGHLRRRSWPDSPRHGHRSHRGMSSSSLTQALDN